MPARDVSTSVIIVRVCKAILKDPAATIAQRLEALRILERNKPPVNKPDGNIKNLRNQKPKKQDSEYNDLLG